MKKLNLLPILLSLAILPASMPAFTQEATSGWKSPMIVTPESSANDCMITPPSDAIILFNGTDLSQFQNTLGEDAGWVVADGTYRTRPVTTVIHNGVLVQNQTTILGVTNKDHSGYPPGEAHGAGPILLQDHNNPISFRNIRIREL